MDISRAVLRNLRARIMSETTSVPRDEKMDKYDFGVTTPSLAEVYHEHSKNNTGNRKLSVNQFSEVTPTPEERKTILSRPEPHVTQASHTLELPLPPSEILEVQSQDINSSSHALATILAAPFADQDGVEEDSDESIQTEVRYPITTSIGVVILDDRRYVPAGIYMYDPIVHGLVSVDTETSGEYAEEIGRCFSDDNTSTEITSGVVLCSIGNVSRGQLFSQHRGYRTALLNAGAVTQEMATKAQQLDYTTGRTTQFYDDRLNKLFGIDGILRISCEVLHITLGGDQ